MAQHLPPKPSYHLRAPAKRSPARPLPGHPVLHHKLMDPRTSQRAYDLTWPYGTLATLYCRRRRRPLHRLPPRRPILEVCATTRVVTRPQSDNIPEPQRPTLRPTPIPTPLAPTRRTRRPKGPYAGHGKPETYSRRLRARPRVHHHHRSPTP